MAEPTTGTALIKKANDNRVLITLWCAILAFVGMQLLNTRDHSMMQPLIDQQQNDKIESMEADIKEIKGDVKLLVSGLARAEAKK